MNKTSKRFLILAFMAGIFLWGVTPISRVTSMAHEMGHYFLAIATGGQAEIVSPSKTALRKPIHPAQPIIGYLVEVLILTSITLILYRFKKNMYILVWGFSHAEWFKALGSHDFDVLSLEVGSGKTFMYTTYFFWVVFALVLFVSLWRRFTTKGFLPGGEIE